MADLQKVIAVYGAKAKSKLSNAVAQGDPEDQLRAPFEQLISDIAALVGLPMNAIIAVGETKLRHLKTRPDYAITHHGALVGFVELKAPGKGADPRKFKDPHDRGQWEKLQSLPNLIYSDGNSFSLWRDGKLIGSIVTLLGDIETSGAALVAPPDLPKLFNEFFSWAPIPPRTAKELAETSARLCRLLRDEVTEQLSEQNPGLTGLKVDWRKLLFPEATDEQFADSYAQAVTFGLLMARARAIVLDGALDDVAKQLGQTSSLIGAALRILTEDVEADSGLKTSIDTLKRVLGVVDWHKISKGNADAWLYFYEDFLDVYDKHLKKLTGSYYTPPPVVQEMVRLVDDVLRTRFSRPEGLAAHDVTVADPAAGTGTFLLGVLARIARTIEKNEGAGAIPGSIRAALKRLLAFELQLGPFAVAQLRLMAEVADLAGSTNIPQLRMYVTDTLGSPYEEQEWLPHSPQYRAIGESRREANKIKRDEPITVVIGNPPYKEKAKGRGGWIEDAGNNSATPAPLAGWIPPAEWGAGAHAKHLRNLYVYFWRWATWKVFDHAPGNGIVCFITVSGFLNGPGFQRMRDYLRRTANEIWVIDCSPDGHQPEVNTRIFQGVQQPVCIVLASRAKKKKPDVPAVAQFIALPKGRREDKFEALKKLRLNGPGWQPCPAEWRASFLPAGSGAWSTFPALEDFFLYNGSGVMPGRTWVISPDAESLAHRWDRLTHDKSEEKKRELFHPHLRNGAPGDKHAAKKSQAGLAGHEFRPIAVADDRSHCITPVRYAFRSFDRQWIIPDNRLINQPNPELWRAYSKHQVHITALDRTSPKSGPALTITELIPDLDHYKGSFGGRVFPLWQDADATESNISTAVLDTLTKEYGQTVTAEDVMAYLAAVMANPAFTEVFRDDLAQPGLRVPMTADAELFKEAVALGRTVVWLHTFGERFADTKRGRPVGPPRLPRDKAPHIPKAGAIPSAPDRMPDSIDYDPKARKLRIGDGFVDGVPPAVWSYEVSDKQVLRHWFSYRKKSRERPIIGDRRPPSKLGDIQPDHWLAEYTTELINLLNVLGWLVDIEPQQADLLERICSGAMLSHDELIKPGGPPEAGNGKKHGKGETQDQLHMGY